jgi:L-rhamnose mutarotase
MRPEQILAMAGLVPAMAKEQARNIVASEPLVMQRYAFKMFLNPGCAEEYKRRHDEIWPELAALLRESGISNYSIHLDPDTNVLFAYLERRDDHTMDELPRHGIMRRWWDHMKDIMAADPDGAPVATPLVEMFHLP